MESIINDGLQNAEAYQQVSEYLNQHPYSSIIQGLKAKGAKQYDPGKAELVIRQSAIRFYNRSKLHDFVFTNEAQTEVEIDQTTTETSAPDSVSDQGRVDELNDQLIAAALSSGAAMDLILEDVETEVHHPDSISDTKEFTADVSLDALKEDVQPIILEVPEKQKFSSWMAYLSDSDEVKHSSEFEIQPKKTIYSKEAVSSIIDHFIDNESEIVPKRAEFFSPTKAAKGSLEDKQEIVTETLATIYTQQGAFDKAISTYNKLSLLHPEKSSYFAALIEKLKKEKTS